MKFIKNGHLEFWTAIDQYSCWQQDPVEMKIHPRLYPYPAVEHPLSFLRLYRALADLLRIHGDILFQMQYLNIKGAILLPYISLKVSASSIPSSLSGPLRATGWYLNGGGLRKASIPIRAR